jgi:predicted esterase
MERSVPIPVLLLYDLHVPEKIRAPDGGALPADGGGGHPLLLALHGYGQTKEWILDKARRIHDGDWLIAALQGPNGFMVEDRHGGQRTGFNWGARHRHHEAVAVHHQALLAVIEDVGTVVPVDSRAIFLLGFSQPVSFNYRFVFTFPARVRGVIGVCGGIPGDHDQVAFQPSATSVLHIGTTNDEFYDADRVRGFRPWLEGLASDVELDLVKGGHAFPDGSPERIEAWIRSRLPRDSGR